MELQEYFDKTVDHLRSGQGRAVNDAGRCVYNGTWDEKCAVGIHIPDGHPGRYFDGNVEALIEKYPDLDGVAVVKGQEGMDMALLLQQTHDRSLHWIGATFNEKGEKGLAEIAEINHLTYTPPEERPLYVPNI